MVNKYLVFILFLFFGVNTAFTQTSPGNWKTHFSYFFPFQVEETPNKIYCLTSGDLFSVSKKDEVLEKLNKVNGLSDVSVSCMKYVNEYQTLVLAYKNGNIDLVEKEEITNIPFIKNEIIPGGKKVYAIDVYEQYVYLATEYGIVVVDLERKEIKETYFIGNQGDQVKVSDISIVNDRLYALVENELKFADLNLGLNLLDYNSWSVQTLSVSEIKEVLEIEAVGDKVVLSIQDNSDQFKLYYTNDFVNYTSFKTTSNEIRKLHFINNHILVAEEKLISVFDTQLNLEQTVENIWIKVKDAIIDTDGVIWFANQSEGLRRYINGSHRTYKPDSPYSDVYQKMNIQDDVVYLIGGGVTSSIWSNQYNRGKFAFLRDEEWTSIADWDAHDYMYMAIDPTDDNHLFFSSWGYGLMEYKNGEKISHYNQDNSLLSTSMEGAFCRLGGLAFDQENNLWIINSGVHNPVSIIDSQGKWHTMEIGNIVNASTMAKLIIDDDNNKWVMLPKPGDKGLFVFNENGTLDLTSDDSYKSLDIRERSGEMVSNKVFDMEFDNDGDLWVGTDQGIAVFYNAEDVFSTNIYASRILVEFEGQTDYLLKYESVLDIAIDGANRKWLATENSGVFLVSENGTDQILHFTSENSSLPSNTVIAVDIDQKTGDVYIQTDQGLLSYRGDAKGALDYFENVYAYPNPVRPEYTGDIFITGLMENTNVKITDLSGNIVAETTSLGGQAVWDGKTLRGERAKTGVYLVFLVNESGEHTAITKILFVN